MQKVLLLHIIKLDTLSNGKMCCLQDSSAYTFHYSNSITITALSQASRARQRNRAVSAGCPISSMVKVNIMDNILYRDTVRHFGILQGFETYGEVIKYCIVTCISYIFLDYQFSSRYKMLTIMFTIIILPIGQPALTARFRWPARLAQESAVMVMELL